MAEKPLILHCEQGTDQWKRARLGIITASKFDDMMTNGRGASTMGKTAYSYMYDLVAEKLTDSPDNEINAHALQWGKDNEANARRLYAMETGVRTIKVGMVFHGKHEDLACSPDGISLLPDGSIDGGLELKCPFKSRIHLEYIENGGVPKEYAWQVQGTLFVTGAPWWDFVSYDPRMPENLRLFVHREYPDKDAHIDLMERYKQFKEQLNAKYNKFKSYVRQSITEISPDDAI